MVRGVPDIKRVIPGARRNRVAVAAACLLVVLVAVVVVLNRTVRDHADPVDKQAHSSPPGTPLHDNLKVLPGSMLVGPVVVRAVGNGDGFEQPMSWFAVLSVTGEPITVWKRYLAEFARALPSGQSYFDVPRCRQTPTHNFSCRAGGEALDTDSKPIRLIADMTTTGNDVNGAYFITLSVDHPTEVNPGPGDAGFPERYTGETAPPPAKPAPAPGTGELVAATFKDSRYVLEPGSQLVAAWDVIAGFSVLLSVSRDSDIDALAGTYIRQTGEAIEFHREVRWKGASNTYLGVSSIVGGNAASVWAVDQPGRQNDYIFYTVVQG
jgi:hypothetical protein